MHLTTAQLQLIKTEINGDPVLSAQPNTPDGAFAIAAALNLPASPTFTVWRTFVPLSDITSNGFTWTLVDALSVGTARIWEWMFDNPDRAINPSKANVRQGIIDVWSGTAPKNAVQAAVFGHCKRAATRVEKILATGTGSDASPAVMGFEGAISYQDVEQARNLP
jgi:hypothetical protein